MCGFDGGGLSGFSACQCFATLASLPCGIKCLLPSNSLSCFPQMIASRIAVVAVAVAAIAQAAQEPCPPGDPDSFVFPAGQEGYGYPLAFSAIFGEFVSLDTGLRTEDVNGDGLPDLLWAFWSNLGAAWGGSQYQQCIYINTGTGWTLSTNATAGARRSVDVHGVRAFLSGLTVGEFVKTMADELGLATGSVEVRSCDGQVRHWRATRMDRLAASEGFTVYVSGSLALTC